MLKQYTFVIFEINIEKKIYTVNKITHITQLTIIHINNIYFYILHAICPKSFKNHSEKKYVTCSNFNDWILNIVQYAVRIVPEFGIYVLSATRLATIGDAIVLTFAVQKRLQRYDA